MSHGPVYKPPLNWYVISIVLAVRHDVCTLVLGTGCGVCTYYKKEETAAFCMYQLYNSLLDSFIVYGIVLSCQIQDELSLYDNNFQRI